VKRFRDNMEAHHPLSGRIAAFGAVNGSSHEAAGESRPGEGDAFHVDTAPPRSSDYRGQRSSKGPTQGGSGAPRKRKTESVNADSHNQRCPACERGVHSVTNCFYVFPEKAEKWFTPNDGIRKYVQYQLENNPDLQQYAKSKRIRSQAKIKQPHTPRVTEESD
jgi:hypothetical protein